jgi:hypothetical protein
MPSQETDDLRHHLLRHYLPAVRARLHMAVRATLVAHIAQIYLQRLKLLKRQQSRVNLFKLFPEIQ